MLRESAFLRRLRKELPVWLQQGWVTPGSVQKILDHVAAQRGTGVRYLPLAFSILGVLLLGAGVITFFAANWSIMPKVAKLTLLFGSMWLAYAGAGYALRYREAPQLGEALLLLGVILFGSNIMLIGQIYHIDAHYPDRIFLWPFLILWPSSLPAIQKKRWMPASHVAMIGLLLWSWFAFQHITWKSQDWGGGVPLYLMQIYFLAYLGIFVLGLVMATYGHLSPFSGVVQRYSAFASLASLYALTFPHLHRGVEWSGAGSRLRVAAQGSWVMVTLTALAAVIAFALWHR